eukprot:g17355.t1
MTVALDVPARAPKHSGSKRPPLNKSSSQTSQTVLMDEDVQRWLEKQEAARLSRIRWAPPIFQKQTTQSRRQFLEDLNLALSEQEMDVLAEELEMAEELREWLIFDLVFGVLVLINALFIGFEDALCFRFTSLCSADRLLV